MTFKAIKELKKDAANYLIQNLNPSTKWIHGLYDYQDVDSIGWIENAALNAFMLRSDDHQVVQEAIEHLSQLSYFFDQDSQMFVRALHNFPHAADQGINADWLVIASRIQPFRSKVESLEQLFVYSDQVFNTLKDHVKEMEQGSLHYIKCITALVAYGQVFNLEPNITFEHINEEIGKVGRAQLYSRSRAYILFSSVLNIWNLLTPSNQKHIQELFALLFLDGTKFYSGPYIKEALLGNVLEPHRWDAFTLERHDPFCVSTAVALLNLPSEIFSNQSLVLHQQENILLGSLVGSYNLSQESYSRLTVPVRFLDAQEAKVIDIQSKYALLKSVEKKSDSIFFTFYSDYIDEALRDEVSMLSIYIPFEYVLDWNKDGIKQSVIQSSDCLTIVTSRGKYIFKISGHDVNQNHVSSYMRIYQGFRPSQNLEEEQYKDWIITCRSIPQITPTEFNVTCSYEPS